MSTAELRENLKAMKILRAWAEMLSDCCDSPLCTKHDSDSVKFGCCMTCGNRPSPDLLEQGNNIAGWLFKKGMSGDSVVVQKLCATIRSLNSKNEELQNKNIWWETHMGFTIPDEYQKWGCDAARMMNEKIIDLQAKVNVLSEEKEEKCKWCAIKCPDHKKCKCYEGFPHVCKDGEALLSIPCPCPCECHNKPSSSVI